MRRSASLTYQRLCVHTARLSTCTRSALIRVSALSRARVAWEETPYKVETIIRERSRESTLVSRISTCLRLSRTTARARREICVL